MSLKSSNQVETNRYQLEVEVDADTFEKAVNQAFHKQGKKQLSSDWLMTKLILTSSVSAKTDWCLRQLLPPGPRSASAIIRALKRLRLRLK